mmetsp:Transcript_944/g.1910  ORF Transcript_944/g.1910 Transcript_944/m.1910 type:complete len:202 (-) Transcript_944:42-647(-)
MQPRLSATRSIAFKSALPTLLAGVSGVIRPRFSLFRLQCRGRWGGPRYEDRRITRSWSSGLIPIRVEPILSPSGSDTALMSTFAPMLPRSTTCHSICLSAVSRICLLGPRTGSKSAPPIATELVSGATLPCPTRRWTGICRRRLPRSRYRRSTTRSCCCSGSRLRTMGIRLPSTSFGIPNFRTCVTRRSTRRRTDRRLLAQ